MPALRGLAGQVRRGGRHGRYRGVARGVTPRATQAGRRVVRAGLIALALLALGEAAPAAFPVWVSVEARGGRVSVDVDGQRHAPPTRLGGAWAGVRFEQPGPLEREYQVDGSDTTFTLDRDAASIRALQGSPLYAADAWLRDEASYSRWERVRLVDLADGRPVAEGRPAVEASGLPAAFRIEAALRRPEAAARVWLLGTGEGAAREGLELDREHRSARWLVRRSGREEELARWYFPEQPAPFAAELLHLLGRAAAAGYGLVLAAAALDAATSRVRPVRRLMAALARGRGAVRWLPGLALAGWLIGAAWVSLRLYRQLPHVLDAVSYSFQARVFRSGHLWLEAPPRVEALKGPFEVVWEGRWFSQYPPGASAIYALGALAGLDWLVGPLAGLALIGATAWSGSRLFGPRTGATALALGVLSPFILFQAGSFLSHPLAGALLAGALAAFVHATRTDRDRWYVLAGALLGAAFTTREAAAALFALPLVAWLVWSRRWPALGCLVAGGLPFAALYAAYNAALTGSPVLLPRLLFDTRDRFGFGDGVGFYGRHTPAAGLVVTDELLTLLQFDLLGWPPLFALGLLGLPLLLGRAGRRDLLLAGAALLFVAAHSLYFTHGVALGPRYYYEALPWLLLLASRGLQAAHAAVRELGPARRAGAGVMLLTGLLSLYALLYYLPRQVERRTEFGGLPNGRRVVLPFVRATPFGPRVTVEPTPALVVTDDWWLQQVVLAPLNCPDLDRRDIQACPALFALATSAADAQALAQAYPGRALLRVVDRGGVLELTRYQP